MNNKGQSQILFVSVMSMIALGLALTGLDRSTSNSRQETRSLRRSQMRSAIESVARQIQPVFQNLSNCSPQIFDTKISRLCLDGSIADATTIQCTSTAAGSIAYTARRAMNIQFDRFTYTINIGRVTPINAALYDNWSHIGGGASFTGVSGGEISTRTKMPPQDAVVELWTSWGNLKVMQNIILINRCQYGCSGISYNSPNTPPGDPETNTCDNSICQNMGPEIGFATLAGQLMGGLFNVNRSCYGSIQTTPGTNDENTLNMMTGDVVHETLQNNCRVRDDVRPDGLGFNYVSVLDLIALREKLRSGIFKHMDPSIHLSVQSCTDANRDNIFNEVDLDLMEKLLRGYLLHPDVMGVTPRCPVGPSGIPAC